MAAAVPLAGWARHRAHARAITWVPCRAPARAGVVGGADPPRTSAPEPAPTPQPSAAPTPLLPFVLPSLGVVELRAELRSRGAATHGTKVRACAGVASLCVVHAAAAAERINGYLLI